MAGDDKTSERTRLVHLGRGARRPVNTPVVRASTVLYESTADQSAAG